MPISLTVSTLLTFCVMVMFYEIFHLFASFICEFFHRSYTGPKKNRPTVNRAVYDFRTVYSGQCIESLHYLPSRNRSSLIMRARSMASKSISVILFN